MDHKMKTTLLAAALACLLLLGASPSAALRAGLGQTGAAPVQQAAYELGAASADCGGTAWDESGPYALGASLGQPDATGLLASGPYELVGGLWGATAPAAGEPDIRVNPESLSATLCPDGSEVQTLDLCNDGETDLAWSAGEDLPWLTVTPTSGTVGPGGCQPLAVEFFGPGSDPFDGVIAFSSNDPDTPLLDVPVSLTVLDPVHDTAFAWDPLQPTVGQEVTFQATAQGSEPIAYAWDFGDGGGGAGGAIVQHTYTLPGDYLVTLTASNACGQEVVQQTVTVAGLPDIDVTALPLEAILCPAGSAEFTVSICNLGSADLEWSIPMALGASLPLEWWAADPMGGTLVPDTCQDVAVTLTANVPPGSYQDQLAIDSNDPDEPQVALPLSLTVLDAAHDAAFTWSPAPGVPGQPVLFEGSAQGTAPIDYAWDFGDGGGGAGAVVDHTYAAPGTYPVILTASNGCGASVAEHDVVVATLPQIQVNPGALAETLCPGGSAVLALQICNLGELELVWALSEAAPLDWLAEEPASGAVPGSDCQEVQVSFSAAGLAPGDYAGTLLVDSNDPDVPQVVVPVGLAVLDPIHGVAFTWLPPEPLPGQVVSFEGSAEGTAPIDYAWVFGDGGTADGASVTHTFAAAGDYPVTMTASNACGQDVVQHTVTVVAGDVVVSGPPLAAELCSDGTAMLSIGICNTGNGPLDWSLAEDPPMVWLGQSTTGGTLDPGLCQPVDVTFDPAGLPPGAYSGTLNVLSSDPDTPLIALPVSLTVWEPAEIVQVTYQVNGLQVQFDATLSGEPPLDILWAFGDGATSTDEDPVHTYAGYGCYDATLAVSNACGDDLWAGQVCLSCDPVHDAAFTWDPAQPYAGQVVTYSGTAQGSEPIGYAWDFGDGGLENGATVTHIFATGRYRVNMTASNGCGQQVVRQRVKVVDPPLLMHVGWMQLTAQPGNGGRYVLRARVQIVDAEGVGVPGATVYVAWTDPDGGVTAQNGRTNILGETAFKVQTRLPGEWELCVTDVVMTGWIYDPDSNVVTCETITVP